MGRLGGFTLIEVIICMALFAAGFAAVAAMLPAGLAMERSLRNDTDAAICGRNALEVMKGRGVHTLTVEYLTRGGAVPQDLASITTSVVPHVSDPLRDREYYSRPGYPGKDGAQVSSENNALKQFWNTNADQRIWSYYPNGFNAGALPGSANLSWPGDTSAGYTQRMSLADDGDWTHWAMGRIHAYKNRHQNAYSAFDFSYPSSILDLSARTHAANVMYCNLASSACPYDARCADPLQNSWKLVAITTAISQGAEWPEQRESNPSHQKAVAADPYDTGGPPLSGDQLSPGLNLSSNSFASMRPKSIQHCGVAPGQSWEAWIRGRCDYTVMDEYWLRKTSNPISEGYDWLGMASRVWYISTAVQDTDRTYKVPVPLSVHAIVYDKTKDLILLRYPQVFAQTPLSGNARLANFWKYRNASGRTTPDPWVDRKLKIGDSLLTRSGGYLLRVKDVLDAAGEAATAPYGPVDWSDGTYQIVRVTPSLSTLPFLDNYESGKSSFLSGDMGINSNREWTNPYLCSAIVAPPPITGGPSPWAATIALFCGFNSPQPYSTQNPFRPWANTAE